jgi:hypothetical protein
VSWSTPVAHGAAIAGQFGQTGLVSSTAVMLWNKDPLDARKILNWERGRARTRGVGGKEVGGDQFNVNMNYNKNNNNNNNNSSNRNSSNRNKRTSHYQHSSTTTTTTTNTAHMNKSMTVWGCIHPGA